MRTPARLNVTRHSDLSFSSPSVSFFIRVPFCCQCFDAGRLMMYYIFVESRTAKIRRSLGRHGHPTLQEALVASIRPASDHEIRLESARCHHGVIQSNEI